MTRLSYAYSHEELTVFLMTLPDPDVTIPGRRVVEVWNPGYVGSERTGIFR
jgi:hypothetical protein